MGNFPNMGLGLVKRNAIYVDPDGSDTARLGRYITPVATLTEALSRVTTTLKTIFMAEGEYEEEAGMVWPNVNGLEIIGLDGGVVISATGSDPVLTIDPTFTAATFEVSLVNATIKHDAQIGIAIDNAHMTRKLNIYLDRVGSEQVSTGDSIDVAHTTAGQAIRIYAKNCDELEGLVDVDVANADDRFRFTNSTLIGGLTLTGAVAGELLLMGSIVLTGGLTVDNANVKTYVGSVYRTDAGVYSELANGYSVSS
jgi:hypothetical protein